MAIRARPKVVLIGGPNGAGKSTLAPALLRDTLKVSDFVNADVIAQGLSAFGSSEQSLSAGRIMLERLHDLAAKRVDFAFESTLASRSFAPWIETICGELEYRFHLIFVWLPRPELAIARVQERARLGGHDIPIDVIRRRYERGVRNFFELYAPLANTWRFYDNSGTRRLLATGGLERTERARDAETWSEIKATYAQEG